MPSSPSRLVFTGASTFRATVRARVDHHLGDHMRDADPRLQRKAWLITLWFVGSYLLLLTSHLILVQFFLLVSYSLAASALGFNVFHDANHGSFSADRHVNLLLS